MTDAESLRLPEPHLQDELAQTMQQRRSVREFAPKPLSLETAARLLWAAQGISSPDGLRTAPSGGALYPLELHLVAGKVAGLPAGSYRYDPAEHGLTGTVRGDLRPALGHAGQNLLLQATALGLGGTVVGAFDDAAVQRLLEMPAGEHPLAILPVGYPR